MNTPGNPRLGPRAHIYGLSLLAQMSVQLSRAMWPLQVYHYGLIYESPAKLLLPRRNFNIQHGKSKFHIYRRKKTKNRFRCSGCLRPLHAPDPCSRPIPPQPLSLAGVPRIALPHQRRLRHFRRRPLNSHSRFR